MTSTLLCVVALLGAGHPNDGPDLDLRIRVEDDRVIFQIIMNLVFCDEIVKVEREVVDDLAPDEEGAMRDALFAYYQKANSVVIDGVTVAPKLTGYEVPEPELSLIPLLPRFGMRALFKLSLELTYPVDKRPERVHLKWGPFPPDYALGFENEVPPMEIPAVFMTEGDEQVVIIFKEEPEYTWHRPKETARDRFIPVPVQGDVEQTIEVPVISAAILGLLLVLGVAGLVAAPGLRRRYGLVAMVGLLAAGACWPLARTTVVMGRAPVSLTEEEALAIFKPLHRNIYRAFDFTKESDIYDALARSVHGDLLEQLYGDVYLSLVMQEEGGALSRVKDVNVLEATVDHVGVVPGFDVEGFQVTARWRVKGAVFHWGHSHERTNEYRAVYSVVRTGDGWRIAANQTLEQRLVETTSPSAMRPAKKEGDGK